jgi:Uma2 family endonuclease
VRFPDATELFPDLAIVRSGIRDYRNRHPAPADTALVVEVSDTSLPRVLGEKLLIYGRSGIPFYWVIDINAQCVYVYSRPTNDGYADQAILESGDVAWLVIDGAAVGSVAVGDLFA